MLDIQQVITRTRDGHRSRAAVLDAAEDLFSAHGYDGASLQDIGSAAGLSRGTPGYLFGSKEDLYVAVLERVFAEREVAVRLALSPVVAWCEGEGQQDDPALRHALESAVARYLRFLRASPAFVRLMAWEQLAGGERLRRTPRDSRALADVFTTLRDRLPGDFSVDDAVLVFVSLTFVPVAYQASALRRDLDERHVKLVVDQLIHLIT